MLPSQKLMLGLTPRERRYSAVEVELDLMARRSGWVESLHTSWRSPSLCGVGDCGREKREMREGELGPHSIDHTHI